MFKRIIFCGCSNTYGHGLSDISYPTGKIDYSKGPSKKGYPNKLAEMFKSKVINLSMPAASNKRIGYSITRLEELGYDPLGPKDAVIFAWTWKLRHASFRHEWGDEIYLHANHSPGSHSRKKVKASKAWLKFRAFADPDGVDLMHENAVWMHFGNTHAKQFTNSVFNIAVGNTCPPELLDIYNVRLLRDYTQLLDAGDKALDGSHPSESTHQVLAVDLRERIIEATQMKKTN